MIIINLKIVMDIRNTVPIDANVLRLSWDVTVDVIVVGLVLTNKIGCIIYNVFNYIVIIDSLWTH